MSSRLFPAFTAKPRNFPLMPRVSRIIPAASAAPPAAEGVQLKDLTREIQRAPGFPEALAALKNGRAATIDGAWGSAAGAGRPPRSGCTRRRRW